MLSVIILCVVAPGVIKESIGVLAVTMLCVIMKSDDILGVIMMNAIMLILTSPSFIILSAVLQSVVIPNVVAPYFRPTKAPTLVLRSVAARRHSYKTFLQTL